ANLSYSITVTNNGPGDAQNVTLTDLVPANTTFVSLTSPAGWSLTTPPAGGTGTVTAVRATLTAGTSASFPLVVAVNPAAVNGTAVINTATATTGSPDPNPGNESATVITTVGTQADLFVTAAGPPTVLAGANLSYIVTVTNNGPTP